MIQFFKKLASGVEQAATGAVILFVDDTGLPSTKDENGAVVNFATKVPNTGSIQDTYFTQITSNATPVVIATSVNTSALAELVVSVKQQSLNNNAAFEFKAYNKAGLVQAINSNIDAALAGVAASIQANGDIQVTGLAATTLKWNVYVRKYAFDDTFPA